MFGIGLAWKQQVPSANRDMVGDMVGGLDAKGET
jgi:hypothetical protein